MEGRSQKAEIGCWGALQFQGFGGEGAGGLGGAGVFLVPFLKRRKGFQMVAPGKRVSERTPGTMNRASDHLLLGHPFCGALRKRTLFEIVIPFSSAAEERGKGERRLASQPLPPPDPRPPRASPSALRRPLRSSNLLAFQRFALPRVEQSQLGSVRKLS